MATINDICSGKTIHSVRVNNRLVEICNKTGLPLSSIVESCLVNFARLEDEQRIQFLVSNDPDKVDAIDLKEPEFDFAEKAIEEAKKQLGNKAQGRTSMKMLIAIGLALLAAVFFSVSNKDKGN